MNTGKLFFEKKIIVTAVIYFLISGILLYIYSIQLGGEAEKYIDNANRIINGMGLRNGVFGFFYFVYSLLVAVAVKFSLSLVSVAIFQISLSFIAALCLYELVIQGLKNKGIAFLFFIAYLLCYPIQKWNFYLYSESIHTSFLVIGVYYFDKFLREKRLAQLAFLGVLVLFILFSRPVGVMFLISLFVVLIVWLYRTKRKILFYIFTGISIVSVVSILNSPLTAFINPDSLKRMEIICQVPENNTGTAYEEFNRQGLLKSISIIKNEIGVSAFFKNGLKKLGYFFGMHRNYYSWQNNLLLLCYTIFYPFVLIGIISNHGRQFYYIKFFAILYLSFTAIAIFFTCDDWANRFISPVFPFILILASAGFLKFSEKFRKIKN